MQLHHIVYPKADSWDRSTAGKRDRAVSTFYVCILFTNLVQRTSVRKRKFACLMVFYIWCILCAGLSFMSCQHRNELMEWAKVFSNGTDRTLWCVCVWCFCLHKVDIQIKLPRHVNSTTMTQNQKQNTFLGRSELNHFYLLHTNWFFLFVLIDRV